MLVEDDEPRWSDDESRDPNEADDNATRSSGHSLIERRRDGSASLDSNGH